MMKKLGLALGLLLSASVVYGVGVTGFRDVKIKNTLEVDGATKIADGTQGTSGQVFKSVDTAGTGGWGAVSLSGSGVTGTLPIANGGTGDTSLTNHNVLLGQGSSAIAFAAPGATQQALVSNGASSDPTFQTLPIAGGGTGQTSASSAFNALSPNTTLGDLIYGNGSGTNTRLAGNITTTKKYLSQTGNGVVSAAPSWLQPACGDLSNAAASCSTDTTVATNITTGTLGATVQGNITTVGTITSGTWSGTTVAVNKGGTGQTSYTDGQLLIGNTSGNTLTKATLTAGTGVTVTNGNGSITIAASGATSAAWNYTSQTSNYNAAINDWVVCSGTDFAVTLPTAVSVAGQSIVIEHNDTWGNVYSLNTTSSQTIRGPNATAVTSGNYKLYTRGENVWLMSDGANWHVIHHKTDTDWFAIQAIGTPGQISATSAYVFSWSGNKSIVQGDTYTDGSGHTYTVSTTANTTSGTFSGNGTPASTGTLTIATGSGASPIAWTSKTTTGAPIYGSGISVAEIYAKRQGKVLKLNWRLGQTSASGAVSGSGDYILYLPTSPNLTIDTTGLPLTSYYGSVGTFLQQPAAAQASGLPSNGVITNGTNAAYNTVNAYMYGANSIRLAMTLSGGSSGNWGSGYVGFAATTTVDLNLYVEIPITELQP